MSKKQFLVPSRTFTRRQMLVTGLGAAGLLMAGCQTATTGVSAARSRRYPVFINHCHIGQKKFGRDTSGRPNVGTVEDLIETLDLAGVAGAVVFAPFTSQGGIDANEWLVRTIAPYPNLVGFATIDPKDPDAVRRLRACVAMKLKGLKIHPPVMKTALNDPACKPFFAAAEEFRMPIVCHTGAHGWYLRNYLPILLDDIAKDHPALPIVIEHVSGMALFDQALSVMMNNKQNVFAGYTMESGPEGRFPESALRAEQTRTLIKVVGPARIIYGSGYPWNSDNLRALKNDIAEIRSWGLSAEDKAKVLGGNLRQLVGPPGTSV